jgi:hypothetical protein
MFLQNIDEFIIHYVEKRFDVQFRLKWGQYYDFSYTGHLGKQPLYSDIENFIKTYFGQSWHVYLWANE